MGTTNFSTSGNSHELEAITGIILHTHWQPSYFNLRSIIQQTIFTSDHPKCLLLAMESNFMRKCWNIILNIRINFKAHLI